MRCTCINYRSNCRDESVELNSKIKVHVGCFSVLHVFVTSCQCLRFLCHWCFTAIMYPFSLTYMVPLPLNIRVSVFMFGRTVIYKYLHQIHFKFDILRTVHHDIFVQQKPTRCTISQLYFDKQLYMIRTDRITVHHQES